MRSKDFILSILLAATSTACVTVAAQAAEGTVIQPDSLTWAPAQGLPPGAEMAVLFGNPGKIGPFAVRFKFPAGYEIPTHSHPTDEVLTVLSGKGRMAFGQKVDADARKAARCGDVHHASGRRVASRVDRCGDRHRATFVWVVRSGARKVAPHDIRRGAGAARCVAR